MTKVLNSDASDQAINLKGKMITTVSKKIISQVLKEIYIIISWIRSNWIECSFNYFDKMHNFGRFSYPFFIPKALPARLIFQVELTHVQKYDKKGWDVY